MTTYINADELMFKLRAAIALGEKVDADVSELESVLSDVESMNKIEIKKGTWSEEYDPNDDLFFQRKYRCSACGDWNTYGFTKYCPNCGAKMLNATALTMEKVMEQWSN